MPKLRSPRVVKIFFSSPFGGMEEEREELTRNYFPSIHHLCNSYGLQFAAVDMRWGITAESSDKAQVINICLREIDRSDMFIGFFGQRYGWHGASDEVLQKNFDNALPHYPWLDHVRDRSVTELEFLHGFLNDPGSLPAALFFRNKAYDDEMREDALKTGDKKQVFKYTAESELSTKMMDNLKKRIWEQREKSLGVHMDYKTPAEAAKIMYDTIMKFLKESLLADLDIQKQTVREELLSQHDAFLASRCNIYVHGEEYMKQLNKQLLAESRKPVLVIGESGSGMSALLCNWISTLKEQGSNYTVVYHFIGFANNSTDINSMLSRIVEEYEFILSSKMDGTPLTKDEKTTVQLDDSIDMTRELISKLLKVLNSLAALGKTPVLVLDGLEKITSTSKIRKMLYWLPNNFPSSGMVVVSTSSADSKNIQELVTRGYVTVHIQPLPVDYKRDMAVKALQESGKELSPPQLERIVAAEMTKNPLFLKITLDELVAFGYFRLLDKKIDSLISAESIEALFQLVLTRLEEDYNVPEYNGNLVEQVMSCIHLSSQGMAETELKEIFLIPGHVWSPLYFAIERLVMSHSGRILFGFRELGAAIQMRYLKDPLKKVFYIQKLIGYWNGVLEEFDKTGWLDGAGMKMCRPALELPNLLLELGDKKQLAECLSNFFVFSYLEYNYSYQLVQWWHQTEVKGSQVADMLLQAYDKRISVIYLQFEEMCTLKGSEPPGLSLVNFLCGVIEFLSDGGYDIKSRENVILRTIHILEDALKEHRVRNVEEKTKLLDNLKYKLACIFCEFYHTAQKGIELHKELLAQCERQLETNGSSAKLLTELGHHAHGIGVGYTTLRDYEKVVEYTKKSIEYHEQSGVASLADLGASYSNLAMCYKDLKKFDLALEYIDKSLKAYEEHYFGESPPVIGEILTNKGVILRNMNRLDEAEEAYTKSLQVKINAVGKEHATVAKAYLNLGMLENVRDNMSQAVDYTRQALQICESTGQSWDNPDYIAIWENLLIYLVIQKNFQEADQDFMTIFKWRMKDGSLDHSLPVLCREMAKYYIREGRFEEAYDVSCGLLDSAFRDDENCVTYLLLSAACCNLPAEYRAKLKEEQTLAYAVKCHPENVSLVKALVTDTLVPNNDVEEIARLINILHEHSDMGADVYILTCPWCVNNQGEVNEACQQRIILEGLQKYPDNPALHLNMAKSYRRLDRPDLALEHFLKIIDGQLDNPQLLMFAAQTAALAGECDVCSQWCTYILEHFGEDENIVNPVKNLIKANEDTREYLKQQRADNSTASDTQEDKGK